MKITQLRVTISLLAANVFRSDDMQPRDWYARDRISSLVDYLARIQEK